MKLNPAKQDAVWSVCTEAGMLGNVQSDRDQRLVNGEVKVGRGQASIQEFSGLVSQIWQHIWEEKMGAVEG